MNEMWLLRCERIPVIAQAMGMVSVQVDCALDAAFSIIVDQAQISRCSVEEIAVATIDRSIRFDE